MRVFQRGAHGVDRLGRRPKRILIRGQFDNCARIDAKFARRFLDRFSSFINRDVPELRICQLPNGSHARNL